MSYVYIYIYVWHKHLHMENIWHIWDNVRYLIVFDVLIAQFLRNHGKLQGGSPGVKKHTSY